MNASSKVNMAGDLMIRLNGQPVGAKKRINGRPVWMWKMQNAARPGYIKGWLARYVGMPIASAFGLMSAIGELRGEYHTHDGQVIDLGVMGRRVITTVAVNFLVDQMETSSGEIAAFDYHASGTGTTAENVTDTAMETDSAVARTNGTPSQPSANIYQSAGTMAYTSGLAITEHGLFNASTSGSLWDRTVFSAINVVNGDSIAFTYQVTFTAGS